MLQDNRLIEPYFTFKARSERLAPPKVGNNDGLILLEHIQIMSQPLDDPPIPRPIPR